MLTLITARKSAHAGSPKKLTGLNAELINEIMNDEARDVPIIQNLLDDPDNPLPVPIRRRPNLNMHTLRQPNLQTFLETASAFENTGSGLYHGALLNITQTQEYFPTRGRPLPLWKPVTLHGSTRFSASHSFQTSALGGVPRFRRGSLSAALQNS